MERRTSARVKARLKVRFKDLDSFVNEYTHNLSKGGIFIRTSKPCGLKEKVEIVLVLPGVEEEVSAIGEVIHIVSPEQATENIPAGMGIQILEMSPEAQKKIEKFIEEKLRSGSNILDRRKYPRVKTKIRVRFTSKEALIDEYATNISHGGIFIQTTSLREVGEELSVILVHPETGEEMHLKGEVVRVVTPEEAKKLGLQPGMGIKFLSLDSFLRTAIEKFIQAETVKTGEKELTIDEY